MTPEPISPELALVDPELGARARAALAVPASAAQRRVPSALVAATAPRHATDEHHDRRYPAWARITAALWLLVIGILVGGAAIPHAQDKPRVIPSDEDVTPTVCMPSTHGPTTLPPRARLGGH